MTRYKIDRVERGAHGQNWDVLAGGDTLGAYPTDSGVWDQMWRWPNFKPLELASRSDGLLMLYLPAMDALQALRSELDRPLTINSAYRSPAHNRKVGGGQRSRHLSGAAFDVAMGQKGRWAFVELARRHGFNGFGFYPSFVHIDFRARPAKWGPAPFL